MIIKRLSILLVIAVVCVGSPGATEFQSSVFENERLNIQYGNVAQTLYLSGEGDEFTELSSSDAADSPEQLSYKSPAKAFFLSVAVPGLGQYYYGSRVKSFLFFGAEVATWAFHIKWHGEGEDMTDEFEAFNRAHWSRTDYEDKYLQWTYGVNDDHEVPVEFKEINHHLPATETQQYFEMTGKYDQFSWGWDDAELGDGRTLDDFSELNPPPRVFWSDSVPSSSNRLIYETMRDDTNSKFDDANKMIVVSIVNRLISGFEAYFTTKSRNGRATRGSGAEFSRLDVKAKLRSYYTKRDTPFLQFTYKF